MLAAYGIFYGACVLFWFAYPSLIVSFAEVTAEQGSAAGLQHFMTDRIAPLFVNRFAGAALSMEYNLLRFAAWMPLFTLPFALLAWPAVQRRCGLALPAFGGIALLLVAMFVILPAQGHGWGYRYLHGFIGNFAILAGYGYARLATYKRAHADGAFVFLTSATCLLIVPFLMCSAHQFTDPYARLSSFPERQRADFVIVDTDFLRAPPLTKSGTAQTSPIGRCCLPAIS